LHFYFLSGLFTAKPYEYSVKSHKNLVEGLSLITPIIYYSILFFEILHGEN